MDSHQSGGALEDRLRGMILSHSDAGPPQHADPNPALATSFSQPRGVDDSQASQGVVAFNGQSSQAVSKARQKRPNQAQRRQMSAQLSIPIDTRPQVPQSAREFGSLNSSTRIIRVGLRAEFSDPIRQLSVLQTAPIFHHTLGITLLSPTMVQRLLEIGNNINRQVEVQDLGLTRINLSLTLHLPGAQGMGAPIPTAGPITYARKTIANNEIEPSEILEKERFRAMIEDVARHAITKWETETHGFRGFPPASVQLRCFGSLASGLATKDADMDLGLVSPLSNEQPDAPGSPIPRLVEKAFLEMGLGARLLSRTRVPIIKVCEKPTERLRADLLEVRTKWENGLGHEELDDDDAHDHADPAVAHDIQPHDYIHHKSEASESTDGATDIKKRFASLKQDKRSLSGYFSSAKHLLRKLGGRDLTHSNSSDLKEDDLRFLNEFCLAFVDGLSNDTLRNRLQNSKSLDRWALLSGSSHRTFLGVYVQAEGELMSMMWDNREVREKDGVLENQAQNILANWKFLCNKPSFGDEPLAYLKELQMGVDLMRKIPSIQIMVLSQGPQESPASYHARTLRYMTELGSHDQPSKDNIVLRYVMNFYVKGISSEKMREEVEAFVNSQPPESLSLRTVARRHKSLQLASDFERCLEKGFCPESSIPSVKAYINILHTSMRPPEAHPHVGLIVPLSPGDGPIFSAIRLLGDPNRLLPIQHRELNRDRLEFPKSGVGVQCDINFSPHLALQNTCLLRCYTCCDPRVRPLILFVKRWARVRGINSPYRGTLGSYGYALMMLHYLINIAQPFLCPNLQQLARPPDPNLPPELVEETVTCKGHNVQFWRDEAEIKRLASINVINQNRQSLGELLCGFFEYYAQHNQMSTVPSRGFEWGREVISIRTHGGLLSKSEKGWTGAKSTYEVKGAPVSGHAPSASQDQFPSIAGSQPSPGPGCFTADQPNSPAAPITSQAHHSGPAAGEVKEVRHRYLVAIEDPFETEHNIARTVTHSGICAIRDEFRRAWRIISRAGKGESVEDLLEDVAQVGEKKEIEQFSYLLDEIHGPGEGRLELR
ncbi:hypothetical protein OQA88_11909 [Cercophora sp. LCS_1]